MTQSPISPEENKKRAAFKRFSQMSAAGLAVLSLSAFADLSAHQLSDDAKNCSEKEQNTLFANLPADPSLTVASEFAPDVPHNLYSNYTNNYSNYSDTPYSNNYSNYCNSAI